MAGGALLAAYAVNACLKNYGLYPKKDLRGKHVFLTGAGGGLGSIFARILGELGCKLTLVDCNKNTLNRIAQKIGEMGMHFQAFEVDMNREGDIGDIVRQCEDRFGPIDILINNSGIPSVGDISEISSEAFYKVIETNFLALINTNECILKAMIKRRSGHVLNISSMAGLIGIRGLSAYCSSKFAMTGFSECIRQELKRSDV